METVVKKTKRIIAETLGVDESQLTYNTHLVNDLGADSLDVVELVSILEKEFGVSIPDEKIEGCHTVGQLIECFESMKPLEIPPHYQFTLV